MLLKSFSYTSYDDGYKFNNELPKTLKKQVYNDLNKYLDSIVIRQIDDFVAIYYIKDAPWKDINYRMVKIAFGVIIDYEQLSEINYLKFVNYCYNYSINSYKEIPTSIEVPIDCFNKIEDVFNNYILNVVIHKNEGFTYEKLEEENNNQNDNFKEIREELLFLLEDSKRKDELLNNIYNKLSKKDENNISEIEIEGIFKKKKETKKFIVHKIQST